jgi:hypothetical protein
MRFGESRTDDEVNLVEHAFTHLTEETRHPVPRIKSHREHRLRDRMIRNGNRSCSLPPVP